MGFEKTQIFAQIPLLLAYCFTEIRQFEVKTDHNSLFLGRHAHIMDRLYIIVMYMSFYGYRKYSNFCSKYVGVILWFY
jgi:hypothetical protein